MYLTTEEYTRLTCIIYQAFCILRMGVIPLLNNCLGLSSAFFMQMIIELYNLLSLAHYTMIKFSMGKKYFGDLRYAHWVLRVSFMYFLLSYMTIMFIYSRTLNDSWMLPSCDILYCAIKCGMVQSKAKQESS